jgi:hypothetical protein
LKAQVLKKAQPLSALRPLDKNNLLTNTQDNHIKWLPLRGKTRDMAVLIDGNSAEVIKIVDINPWSQ